MLDLKQQMYDLVGQIRLRTFGYGPVRVYIYCFFIGLFVWLWGPMVVARTILELE